MVQFGKEEHCLHILEGDNYLGAYMTEEQDKPSCHEALVLGPNKDTWCDGFLTEDT